MKIVIPAAGQGTRLRPHTHTLPKVLLPVAGRPIIGHILADVEPLKPDEVRLVVGYMGDRVLEYAEQAFPSLSIRGVWQAERQGLGHAVLQALDSGDHDPVLILLGDTVFEVDYSSLVAQTSNALGVREVPDPERFGIVELDEKGAGIVRLVEKPAEPKSNLALAGLYYIQDAEALRSALQGLVDDDQRTRGEFQLTDALQRMVSGGAPFVAVRIDGWYDCGKPETLLDTNRALLERGVGVGPRREGVIEPSSVGQGCTIENAIVGPYVTLGSGASIRNAIVKDSIIGERAIVENAVLERSIIGPDAIVRSRAQSLNLGDGSEFIC